jgi:hypothetical protein
VWDESRSRQTAAHGRARFAPGDLAAQLDRFDEAVVRVASGVAYVPHEIPIEDGAAAALVGRIRRELDPQEILAA